MKPRLKSSKLASALCVSAVALACVSATPSLAQEKPGGAAV